MELKTVYEIFTKCWLLYKKYHGAKMMKARVARGRNEGDRGWIPL